MADFTAVSSCTLPDFTSQSLLAILSDPWLRPALKRPVVYAPTTLCGPLYQDPSMQRSSWVPYQESASGAAIGVVTLANFTWVQLSAAGVDGVATVATTAELCAVSDYLSPHSNPLITSGAVAPTPTDVRPTSGMVYPRRLS